MSEFLSPFESNVLSNNNDATKTQILVDGVVNGIAFVNQTASWWVLLDSAGLVVAHIVPFTSGNINLPSAVYERVTIARDLTLPPLGSTAQYAFRIRLDADISNNASTSSISSQTATATFSGALAAGNAHVGQVGIDTALPSGANNIGSVNVAALPALPPGANAIGTVGVTSLPSLPAGANNIGSVNVAALPALPTGANNIGIVNLGTTAGLPVAATAGVGSSNQVALGVAAAAILNAVVTGKHITIINADPTLTIYLGAAGVTTATGLPLLPGQAYDIDIVSGSTIAIYGISASGTPKAAYLVAA